jgi:hypothetical protein
VVVYAAPTLGAGAIPALMISLAASVPAWE